MRVKSERESECVSQSVSVCIRVRTYVLIATDASAAVLYRCNICALLIAFGDHIRNQQPINLDGILSHGFVHFWNSVVLFLFVSIVGAIVIAAAAAAVDVSCRTSNHSLLSSCKNGSYSR